ncbi:MAG: arabinofuranan 3-O-arabinosyltransferase, partial [Cryptosporangiaceae bacterium]|nr:arabinofuranan 3-O-arabinosyltransferase [Cryptosporangiaceae bacterium]
MTLTAPAPVRAPELPDPPVRGAAPALVYRMRLAAVSVGLAALAFAQDPVRLSRDTKLDLYVDPGRFLLRALQVWDPETAFGSLQNQAYGYLFPMGPYFLLTRAIGMPVWMAQRFWMSLLIVTAFLGIVRLCAVLRIGGPVSRIAAGLAFALSPRVADTIGPISSEILPLCVAPWALIPLVGAYRRGGARGAAARSALAILCAGGINAVATLAVCVPPAIWLLTRAPGAARRRLAAWWALAVTLVCLWWAIPLLVLGGYSFPFLDYIESSSVTTSSASMPEILRGGSHWVAGLFAEGGPWWRGAWITETNSLVVLYSLVLAGLGLGGIAWRRIPHRLFLVGCLVAGCLLIGLGYGGPGGSAVAGPVRALLDGPLAPFRNTHKFDLVVRIPLTIGFCHLLTVARWPFRGWLVRATGALAVAVVATPFLLGQIVPAGSYAEIPPYWNQAADWLSSKGAAQRSLLLPSSSFGEYKWGRPMDEPFHALMRAPWAVRDQIPLGSEGSIRVMDAVEDRVESGQGSPGLARFLARAGVRYVVIRNDLDWPRIGAAKPAVVRQALLRSGGFRLAASFGCCVAGGLSTPQITSDYGQDELRPSVEVYEVTGTPAGAVESYPADDVVSVAGGPEALLAADDRGLLPSSATVLAGDPDGTGTRPWRSLTGDGLRRREVNFGAATANVSATLTEQEPFVQPRRAVDYLPFPGATTTVAEYRGASVTASSSASDADAYVLRGSQYHPGAAIDGNPASAWISGVRGQTVGQWWQAAFAAPTDLPELTVRMADTAKFGATPSELQVAGESIPVVGGVAKIPARKGVTTLRITIARLEPGSQPGGLIGISEITGLNAERFIRSAYLPAGEAATGPAAVVLDRAAGSRDPCVQTFRLDACNP